MKLTPTIGIASALLLAAGCAHEEHSVQTTSPTYSPYSGQSEYHAPNNVSSSSAGSMYSSGRPSHSDNSVVSKVRETLQRDAEIAFVVPNIQISANNGAVILTGSVQSEEQKRQIMAKVLQVDGVLAVNNQLTVTQLNSTGTGPDRLYKDSATDQDISTNNALNQISHDDRAGQLYRESNQKETNSIELRPTSRENGSTQIYQSNPAERAQDQNLISNTNNNQQMP